MDKCPICETLRTRKLHPKGTLCKSCHPNHDALREWHGLKILDEARAVVFLYVCFFPFIMMCSILTLIITKTFVWTSIPTLLVGCGLWVFNIFFFWPRQDIPSTFKGIREQMEEKMDDLFLAKLRVSDKW